MKEEIRGGNEEARKAAMAKRWLQEVELYEKEFTEWKERSKKILNRYRNEKQDSSRTRFNVFWSNVETLKPALYARTPKPEVERKYKDADPVGRAAAEILERATTYAVREYDFDSVMKNIRDDYLRVGRGTAWVRYVPRFEPMKGPDGQPVLEGGEPVEQIAYEEARCDYVHWDDFVHGPGRIWDEVQWVGKRLYLTRAEVKAQFGEKVAKEIQLTFLPKNITENGRKAGPEHEMLKKACIVEIWDKTTKEVIWVSDGFKGGPLKTEKDPLQLKGFFPCPRPLYATLTTDSLVPLPDYTMYQDLAMELDDVSLRESLLMEAVRVAGVYDGSQQAIADLVNGSKKNQLIPVKDWARFAGAGGIEGNVQFMPLKDIVQALQILSERKQQLKADLFEITGMSDIVRGHTNPNETATAQQLKGQFATLRISDRQAEVQRFARDVIAIMAEIIAERFQPETLALAADVEVADPSMVQQFQAAVALLKNDAMRSFRIGIETDSTIAMDDSQEKQDRNEYITAIGGFMGNALQMMQAAPALTPAIGEMLLFLSRGFKAGRSLEGALEQGIQATMQQLEQQQNQPPPPDPKAEAAQVKAQADQQKQQGDIAKMQLQMRQMQEKHALEMQALEAELIVEREKLGNERERMQMKTQGDIMKAQFDQAARVRKMQMQERPQV